MREKGKAFCYIKSFRRRKNMKKLIIAAMVAAFVMSSSMVMAATVKCKVESVEGDKVTMTCQDADDLKAGDKVKVKASGKKAYEGC